MKGNCVKKHNLNIGKDREINGELNLQGLGRYSNQKALQIARKFGLNIEC
jgi:hypothetical protein